ncbi:secretin and TonB N-terminal domain-containing protein [Hydrogenophaga sp.]|uniref:secretin and TonB N-terminal domain-containing protein n=1 Tax=Hydrogenophaga sp. TaxID=1904254 RepID=UPI00261D9660|nr:secretin and TonB N-terminal domain-containing protein [Hydrogenophaga sp.]MDM7948586.1 secretin and TonB N-terminal domain-containing protein [Hydrogenophaga sp.]
MRNLFQNFPFRSRSYPLLCGLLVLAGCSTHPAIKESQALLDAGQADESVVRLAEGLRGSSDPELRTTYFRQRERVVQHLVLQAETERLSDRLDAAQSLLERAQRLDPNSPRVRDGLIALEAERHMATRMADARSLRDKGDAAGTERVLRDVLSKAPTHAQARRMLAELRAQAPRPDEPPKALTLALAKPISLDFKDAQIKSVFDVIARTAGVNFVFDKDVRADTRITIFVRNATLEEVIRLVLTTNQLARKLLNDNTLMIYPDTPVKAREYQELVTKSFFLANADVKQAQALVRTIVKSKDIFVDEKLNLLVVKDTADAVALAERLLESLDVADPEVVLDVEVLEISRSRLLELGLRFPDQIGYGRLQSDLSTTIVNNGVTQSNTTPGGTLAEGVIDLRNRVGLTSFVTNPALTLNLRSEAGEGNTLANPRIRVKNREKAKIHIGDKLPVFTTTSVANVGLSSSVSYLDVGLKLDVEPNVYLDNEVAIRVALEVSSVTREVVGPSNSLAYQIGTRSAATVLRLRDGETQVLAGLISDEERSSANRLPGLGDLPGIGRLFSSTRDNASKTEIVLLITPRVVRNVTRPDSAINAYPAGSEANVGTLPLQLRRTAPGSLSVSGSAAPGVAPVSSTTDGTSPPRPAGVNPRAAESRAAQPAIEAPADAAPAPAASGTEPAGQPVTPASPAAPAPPAAPNSSVILTPVAPLAPVADPPATASPSPAKAP